MRSSTSTGLSLLALGLIAGGLATAHENDPKAFEKRIPNLSPSWRLDIEGANPWSRVPNSPFRTFQAMHTWANSFLNSSDPVLSTRSRRPAAGGADGGAAGVRWVRALPRSPFSFTPLPTGSPSSVPSPAE